MSESASILSALGPA